MFASVTPGAITDISAILHSANVIFKKILILSGSGPTRELGKLAEEALAARDVETCLHTIQIASFSEVKRIKSEVMEDFFPDAIIAVGGGR